MCPEPLPWARIFTVISSNSYNDPDMWTLSHFSDETSKAHRI